MKCKKCGADMVELFSSSVCSKDCKGDTPLETPDEKLKFCEEPGYQKAMKEAGGSWKSRYNRSGSYPAPTEDEIQQQKKKMLKALANFNTIT